MVASRCHSTVPQPSCEGLAAAAAASGHRQRWRALPRVDMSTEAPHANVADDGVVDSDSGRSDLVGNTMLSTWDLVSVAIYFLLVVGTGIYVSTIFENILVVCF